MSIQKCIFLDYASLWLNTGTIAFAGMAASVRPVIFPC
jgi:hypothetical protein